MSNNKLFDGEIMLFDGVWLNAKLTQIYNILALKGQSTINELVNFTKQPKTTVRQQILWLESINAVNSYYSKVNKKQKTVYI